jgi:hypothetical protein
MRDRLLFRDIDLKVIKEFQNLASGIKTSDRGSLSLVSLQLKIFYTKLNFLADTWLITVFSYQNLILENF